MFYWCFKLKMYTIDSSTFTLQLLLVFFEGGRVRFRLYQNRTRPNTIYGLNSHNICRTVFNIFTAKEISSCITLHDLKITESVIFTFLILCFSDYYCFYFILVLYNVKQRPQMILSANLDILLR